MSACRPHTVCVSTVPIDERHLTATAAQRRSAGRFPSDGAAPCDDFDRRKPQSPEPFRSDRQMNGFDFHKSTCGARSYNPFLYLTFIEPRSARLRCAALRHFCGEFLSATGTPHIHCRLHTRTPEYIDAENSPAFDVVHTSSTHKDATRFCVCVLRFGKTPR